MPQKHKTDQFATAHHAQGATKWAPEHVAAIAGAAMPEQAIITAKDVPSFAPDLFLWDIWPVQTDDGSVADIGGGSTLWVMLSALRGANPDTRHDVARMRLIQRTVDGWRDCGHLLPDDFSPGSREWSGSTRLDPKTGVITLWFTATGHAGLPPRDFEQRLFHVSGQLDVTGDCPAVRGWGRLVQSIIHDGARYADLTIDQGVPGRIKGFRDPYWFRDPQDGQGYLLFTGSKSRAASQSDYDGVIGIAAANDSEGLKPFHLLPPIIDADGLSNELERPHVIVQNAQYYLFWSTQQAVFAPGGPVGPTALYGMVGPSLFGPFTLLNGTGLVMANPAAEPRQAYAWQVLPSLEVISFVDLWGLQGRDPSTDPALKAQQFGGTVAPFARIALDGATSRIVSGGA